MPDPQSEPSLNRSIGLVIFDLDGVLCDWHPHRRLEFLSQLSGRDSEWIRRTIFDSAFETGAETGAYPTGEAYLAGFNQQLGFALSRQQWVTARQAAMRPRPAMLAPTIVQARTGTAWKLNCRNSGTKTNAASKIKRTQSHRGIRPKNDGRTKARQRASAWAASSRRA